MSKHRAPDVGHDPATCPYCLRVSFIADHGLRHVREEIAPHRYVMAVAR